MDFFVYPSQILLSLFCISVTHASPLDLAGSTQVTGPQEPATDAVGIRNASVFLWFIPGLVGFYMVLGGFRGGRVRKGVVNGVVIGSALAIACKLIDTEYR